MFFPVLPFSSDLECYRLIKFDQLWCQVWADLGRAKHLLLTFVLWSFWANTAFQLRFRRLLFDQIWPYLMSNLSWFSLGKAFYGMLVVWSFWANNAFQLRFSGLLFGPIWLKVLSPLTRFRLGSAFFQAIATWPFWANNAFQLIFPRLLFDHVFRNTAFKLWLSRLLLDYICLLYTSDAADE